MLMELWREAQRLHEAFNIMQNGQDSYGCSQTEHCHGIPITNVRCRAYRVQGR
jgi:hypothetical protein